MCIALYFLNKCLLRPTVKYSFLWTQRRWRGFTEQDLQVAFQFPREHKRAERD